MMYSNELNEVRKLLYQEVIEVAKIRLRGSTVESEEGPSNESLVGDKFTHYLSEIGSAVNKVTTGASKGKFLFKKLNAHTKKLAQFNKLRMAKITGNMKEITQLSRIGVRYDINPEIKIDDIREYLAVESDDVLMGLESATQGLEKLSTMFNTFKEFIDSAEHEDSDLERLLANLELHDLQIGATTYNVDYEARAILVDVDYYRDTELTVVELNSPAVSEYAKAFKKKERKYTTLVKEISNYSPDFDKVLKHLEPKDSNYSLLSDIISVYQTILIELLELILDILSELSLRIFNAYEVRINRQGITSHVVDDIMGPRSSGRFDRIN